jgi:hypothetical protein
VRNTPGFAGDDLANTTRKIAELSTQLELWGAETDRLDEQMEALSLAERSRIDQLKAMDKASKTAERVESKRSADKARAQAQSALRPARHRLSSLDVVVAVIVLACFVKWAVNMPADSTSSAISTVATAGETVAGVIQAVVAVAMANTEAVVGMALVYCYMRMRQQTTEEQAPMEMSAVTTPARGLRRQTRATPPAPVDKLSTGMAQLSLDADDSDSDGGDEDDHIDGGDCGTRELSALGLRFHVDEWDPNVLQDADDGAPRTVVVGSPGKGKSFLTAWLARYIFQERKSRTLVCSEAPSFQMEQQIRLDNRAKRGDYPEKQVFNQYEAGQLLELRSQQLMECASFRLPESDVSEAVVKRAIAKGAKPAQKALVLLDDVATSSNGVKDDAELTKLFTSSRHSGTAVVLGIQRLTFVSPDARNNTTFIIFMNTPTESDFKTLSPKMSKMPRDAKGIKQIVARIDAICSMDEFTACVLCPQDDYETVGLKWFRAPKPRE